MEKKEILIVDGVPESRAMLKNILTNHDLEVVGEARNGKEALKLYKKLKPDMITINLIMPELDGIQALKNILDYDPKAKAVVVSAIEQRKFLIEALKLGAIIYIAKPSEDGSAIAEIIEKSFQKGGQYGKE